MRTHTIVCPFCNGSGRYHAKELPSGLRPREFQPIHPPHADTGDIASYLNTVSGFMIDCRRCETTGELIWSRGRSLTPILDS